MQTFDRLDFFGDCVAQPPSLGTTGGRSGESWLVGWLGGWWMASQSVRGWGAHASVVVVAGMLTSHNTTQHTTTQCICLGRV
jgi:hypothetical protein